MNEDKKKKKKKAGKTQERVFLFFVVLPIILRVMTGVIWTREIRKKITEETAYQIAKQSDFPDSYFNRARMTEEYRIKKIWLYKDFLTIYVVPEIEYHSTRALLHGREAEAAIRDIDDYTDYCFSDEGFLKPPFTGFNLEYLSRYERVWVIQKASVVLFDGKKISVDSHEINSFLPKEKKLYNPFCSVSFFLLYVIYFIILVNVLGKIFDKIQRMQTGTAKDLSTGE